MEASDPSQEHALLSVAVPRPLDGFFTYRVSPDLASKVRVGSWVKVPFGRSVTHAYVIEPPFFSEGVIDRSQLRDILEVGADTTTIPADILELCRWASEYYHAPLGEVLNCAAPAAALGLRSQRKEARPIAFEAGEASMVSLTDHQKEALAILESCRQKAIRPNVALLKGVTGSGKTELYLELARRTLADGKGIILLVPEIALTPQLHERFESGLGMRVALWHSAVSDGRRRDQWAAVRSGQMKVVVGARSAVFAPVQDLGLIVVDEEHDSTYKQDDRVRYHARDLAVVRSKLTGAFVVLGSATPSLETQERVREGRYAVAYLTGRIGRQRLPEIDVVDLSVEDLLPGTQSVLAERTITAIRETLESGKQAMVFLNRRGYASFLVCRDCGDVPGCPNCSISLTVHKRAGRLRCHICAHVEIIPKKCKTCSGGDVQFMGAGTESLEDDLPRLIPGARPLRLDRDQITSASRLDRVLADFREGRSNLLLGTQMLVKGHDFPNVTLVVVILADSLFRFPDFKSPERAYQVLTQVAGRAGRGDQLGKVLIQTYQPDHPVIQAVTGRIGAEEFLGGERELRRMLTYPPFGRLVRLRFEDDSRNRCIERAEAIAAGLRDLFGESGEGKSEILGPSEAFVEKINGIYRWDILVKSTDVQKLHRLILAARRFARERKWPILVDVDPNGVA